MSKHSISRSLVLAAALALIAGIGSPALAQHRRGRDHNRGATVVVRQAPRVVVAARPYYAFRPRARVSTGFFVGFPFRYSFGYYRNPYPYAAYGYPYPAYPAYQPYPTYGYPAYSPYPYSPYSYPQQVYPQGSMAVQPGAINAGGASFEIVPDFAELFVDGMAMGPVSRFTPFTAPLSLTPGRHRFEIRAQGYRTIVFEADIIAGQVTPFQGTLER